MGKIDKITPFVSKTMVDFVENGITAATEAQNAKAENTGSSTMPGMYQGAQVIKDKQVNIKNKKMKGVINGSQIYGTEKWLANI